MNTKETGKETAYASFLIRVQLADDFKQCRGHVEHIQSRRVATFVGWQELAVTCRCLLTEQPQAEHPHTEET